MYESYPWPGAYTIKEEMRFFAQWVESFLMAFSKKSKKEINPNVPTLADMNS